MLLNQSLQPTALVGSINLDSVAKLRNLEIMCILKTPCGHTVLHIPQPTQFSFLSFNVVTFSIYLKSFI